MENPQLKQLFHIDHPGNRSDQCLSMVLGNRHAAFAITGPGGTTLHRLAYCRRETSAGWGWETGELDAFLAAYPCLQEPFREKRVGYEFSEGMLLGQLSLQPAQASLLSGCISGHNGKMVTEPVPGWQLQTLCKVPAETIEWVEKHFPGSRSLHQYNLSVQRIGAGSSEGRLRVEFRGDEMLLSAAQNNRLLLVQAFGYTTPSDALYHLLNACRHFSLDPGTVQLEVSGLLEMQSALYRELFQYFRNLSVRGNSWDTGPDYPSHFFTHLNDLATCA